MVAAMGTRVSAQVEVVGPPIVDTQKEYKVKAVYLYSFGRFTRWPAETGADFTIGVVGSSPVVESLLKVARKRKIRNQQILIKTYATPADVPTDECQIVFVTRHVDSTKTADLLLRLRSRPVITVTESRVRNLGTVVNFILEADNIHFELNIEEAQRKKLSMDARLLRQGRKMLPSSPTPLP